MPTYLEAWGRTHVESRAELTPDRIRLVVLQQRKLFGSFVAMGKEIGVSSTALSQFVGPRPTLVRSDSKILRALGMRAETVIRYNNGDGTPTYVRRYLPEIEL